MNHQPDLAVHASNSTLWVETGKSSRFLASLIESNKLPVQDSNSSKHWITLTSSSVFSLTHNLPGIGACAPVYILTCMYRQHIHTICIHMHIT